MIKVENIHKAKQPIQTINLFFFYIPVFKSSEYQVDHRDTDLSESRSLVSWYASNFSLNSWRKLYCYKRQWRSIINNWVVWLREVMYLGFQMLPLTLTVWMAPPPLSSLRISRAALGVMETESCSSKHAATVIMKLKLNS